MKALSLTLASILCLSSAVGCKKETTVDDTAPTSTAPLAEQKADAVLPDDSKDAAEAAAQAADAQNADAPAAVVDANALNAEDPATVLATVPGEGTMHAVFKTSMGDIDCVLFDAQVPTTVANFVGLATGQKTYVDPVSNERAQGNFYDGVIFHRVIPGFMIQTGDRLGKGIGGPGYQFADEFDATLRHDGPGILSMANAGPGTNGSQFFITDAATPHLNDRHSVFGKCGNLDVVSAIANVPRNRGDKPDTDVTINSIVVERRAE